MAKRAAATAIDLISLARGCGVVLHRRIYLAVLDAIVSGKLPAGARLPSTRALSRALGVSRNSVMHAFEQLQSEGYVETKVGSGTRATGRLPKPRLRKLMPAGNPIRPASARLARLISLSGYPVEPKEIEDWEGNGLYVYES